MHTSLPPWWRPRSYRWLNGFTFHVKHVPDWRDHKVALGDADTPDRVRNVCRTWKQVQHLLHGGGGAIPLPLTIKPGTMGKRVFAGGRYRGAISAETCIARSVATLTARCNEEQARVIAAGEAWDGALDYFAYTLGTSGGTRRMGIAVRLLRDYAPSEYEARVRGLAWKLESSLGVTVDPASLSAGHRLPLPAYPLAPRAMLGLTPH